MSNPRGPNAAGVVAAVAGAAAEVFAAEAVQAFGAEGVVAEQCAQEAHPE